MSLKPVKIRLIQKDDGVTFTIEVDGKPLAFPGLVQNVKFEISAEKMVPIVSLSFVPSPGADIEIESDAADVLSKPGTCLPLKSTSVALFQAEPPLSATANEFFAAVAGRESPLVAWLSLSRTDDEVRFNPNALSLAKTIVAKAIERFPELNSIRRVSWSALKLWAISGAKQRHLNETTLEAVYLALTATKQVYDYCRDVGYDLVAAESRVEKMIEAKKKKEVEGLTALWAGEFGDPKDPTIQAKIDNTVKFLTPPKLKPVHVDFKEEQRLMMEEQRFQQEQQAKLESDMAAAATAEQIEKEGEKESSVSFQIKCELLRTGLTPDQAAASAGYGGWGLDTLKEEALLRVLEELKKLPDKKE